MRKKIYVEKDTVVKVDLKLDSEWKKRLTKIMEVIELPVFVKFIYRGYITKLINGKDLQEDFPFLPRHDIVRAFPLNDLQRERVIKIFRDVVFAGITTGYTLADFTKRNIIMKGDEPYLIDFDVIIEGPLNEDYIRIFQTMIDYLKIDYKFTGNLKELHERLS